MSDQHPILGYQKPKTDRNRPSWPKLALGVVLGLIMEGVGLMVGVAGIGSLGESLVSGVTTLVLSLAILFAGLRVLVAAIYATFGKDPPGGIHWNGIRVSRK